MPGRAPAAAVAETRASRRRAALPTRSPSAGPNLVGQVTALFQRMGKALTLANEQANAQHAAPPLEPAALAQARMLNLGFLRKCFDDASEILALEARMPADSIPSLLNRTLGIGLAAAERLLIQAGQDCLADRAERDSPEAAAREQAMSPSEKRADAGEHLRKCAQDLERVGIYRQFVQAVIDRTPADGAGTDDPTRHPRAVAALRRTFDVEATLHAEAIMAHGRRFDSHEFSQAVIDASAEVTSAMRAIPAVVRRETETRDLPDAAPIRAQIREEMQAALERLESRVGRFVAAAAEDWTPEGDGPERWQHVCESARTLADYAGPALALVRLHADPAADADASSAAEQASAPAPTQEADASASSRKPGRSRRRSNAARAASQPAAPAGPGAAAVRAAALAKTDRLLQKHEALTTRAVAAGHGDLQALLHAEQAQARHQDPIRLAAAMRSAVQTRYGKVADLREVRSRLAALEGSPDAEVQSRLAQLDDRIEALQQAATRIRDIEVEALKTHPLPDGDHVQRLLTLGAIRSVGDPVRLPSDGDVGARGTLFEMRIQAHPLADGTPASPLFLHVHTRQLATADGCLALQFGALAAVHVKTAAQRRMGGKWAPVQQSLERLRVRVHRGAVQPSTWETLRAMPPGAKRR